jgi:serine/threonine protein kinase
VRLTRLDNGVVTTSVADWGVRGDVAEAVGEETLTPYTAPEQVADEAAGTRTDVYRYAAVAYFMLTGYVPYAEAEDLATAISEEGPPSATTANPNLTTATGNVLQWAMSTDPEDRYATPAAFKQALTETLR